MVSSSAVATERSLVFESTQSRPAREDVSKGLGWAKPLLKDGGDGRNPGLFRWVRQSCSSPGLLSCTPSNKKDGSRRRVI